MRNILKNLCVLSLAAALAAPAFSQGTTAGSAPSSGTSTTSGSATADAGAQRDDGRGFNWGWLGLLGLAGLMGLRRNPDVPVATVNRTTR